MRSGTAGVIARGVVLVMVCGAALVSAQPPVSLPPVNDPYVEPAQLLNPVPPPTVPDSPRGNAGVISTPPRTSSPVVDPPPPVVQLQVRTPAHVPLGKPVPYKVTVTNSSQAKALRVKVRMPWPEGAAAMTRCEPKPDAPKPQVQPGTAPPKDWFPPAGTEMYWEVGDLPPGKSQTVEMTFTPAADAKKVSGTAYVSFEYGAKVETSLDKAKLTVKKTATPEVAVGELVTVRVEVTNPGQVAIPKVKLVEYAAPQDVEFRGDDGAVRSDQQDGYRAWDLGTLAAGQTKVVQYQLLTRKAGECKSASAVTSEVTPEPVQASSLTKVLQPALKLEFTGVPTAAPKSPAVYKAVVRNVGTLPLTDVKLVIDVPEELEVKRRTNGAKVGGGRQAWTIPRLPAGEAQEFNLECVPTAGVSGKKLLKASVQDGRGMVQVQTGEAATEFVGKADLTWKPVFEKAWVQVGHQRTLTVTVTNQGSESDNGVRLRVKLPPEVKYIDTNGPVKATYENAEVLFPAQKLAPGKSIEFTVTFEGKTAGQGRFALMLEGESLGGKPLTKEQTVEVEK